MQEQSSGDTLTDLVEATAIQGALIQHRLALEWGKTLFDRLLRNWMQLEMCEELAYEDKVKSQIILANEAVTSLSDLHKTLGRFRHQLKGHRQQLSQARDPWGL